MDVIAHGLWGGALFYPRGWRQFCAGILIGMAPDLLSFGVFHVTHPGWLTMRLAGEISGPPALTVLPPYVFHAYNVTHSAIEWTVAFFTLWQINRRPPWLLAPWLLHILCDIPTHSTSYFPTPFFWPLPTPFIDGVPWSTTRFMAANYATMFVVYSALFLYIRRRTS